MSVFKSNEVPNVLHSRVHIDVPETVLQFVELEKRKGKSYRDGVIDASESLAGIIYGMQTLRFGQLGRV